MCVFLSYLSHRVSFVLEPDNFANERGRGSFSAQAKIDNSGTIEAGTPMGEAKRDLDLR
jgi:hypothetical protein